MPDHSVASDQNVPPLLIERANHVETWTINRPERRNPISDSEFVDAFVDAAEAVNRAPSVRAVILTGAGSAFSAGGDVKAMRSGDGIFGGQPHEIADGYRHGIQRIPLAVRAIEVPIIAAVNGPAVGAGCDLATMCDIRIAAEKAWFAESFVTLGIIPGDGGAWFLPRLIGPARAAEMTYTGKRVPAAQALEWGLVNCVVPGESLLDEARELAEHIAAQPPHALRMAKRLLRESEKSTLPALLEFSAALQALAHHAPDHAEAIAAFLDKRPPSFGDD